MNEGFIYLVVGVLCGIGLMVSIRPRRLDPTGEYNRALSEVIRWCKAEAEWKTYGPKTPAYHILMEVANHVSQMIRK